VRGYQVTSKTPAKIRRGTPPVVTISDMFQVTKLIANKANDRVVFVASAPDDSVFVGGTKEVLGTIKVQDGLKADVIAASLNADDFVIVDEAEGFGTPKKK
jgi:hypothetical protein